MYTNIITVFACLGLKRGFKVIICEHIHTENFLKYEKFSGFKKILIKFAYNKADKIVAVSKGIKKVLEEKFYIASDNITVIYNPIPLEEIKVKMSAPVECKFFSEGNNSIIIGVGRLERQKRFDILLKAFELTIKEVNSARLIILGQGNLEKELKKLAVNLKIDSQVYFGGFQANSYAWLSKAALFVLSSDYEGFPMSILEAMACGIPVISSDCLTGPNEIIVNGENGILVPPDDVGALAKKMLILMKDPLLRNKLSCNGQKRAEDFEMGKIISQYELLLL
jgi:glycosyltransferase involved in cell wall biosynthesis